MRILRTLAIGAAPVLAGAYLLVSTHVPHWLFATSGAVLLAGLAIWYHTRLRARVDKALARVAAQGTQLALAEQLSGLGRISFTYPGPRLRWSREFCRLAGLEGDVPPSPVILHAILRTGLAQVETTLDAHRHDREPFLVEFELLHPEKGERVMQARAQNQFAPDGSREQAFLAVRDVTEEYRRFAQLEAAREAALVEVERASRLADIDPLTGVANRRAAMRALDRALLAGHAEDRPLALLAIDIDNFKRVNDSHGHPIGDRVLRRVADLARRQARLGDCVARIGGEEFLWIMPGMDARGAQEAAERLRWAVEAGTALAPMPSVTVSVGWALRMPSDTGLTLFARADAALYAAKREGRNKVRAAA